VVGTIARAITYLARNLCLASLMLTSYALQELLLTEEKAANQLELDREKGSVAHLSQARADIEGTIFLSLPYSS